MWRHNFIGVLLSFMAVALFLRIMHGLSASIPESDGWMIMASLRAWLESETINGKRGVPNYLIMKDKYEAKVTCNED